jgi:hypothetical protein
MSRACSAGHSERRTQNGQSSGPWERPASGGPVSWRQPTTTSAAPNAAPATASERLILSPDSRRSGTEVVLHPRDLPPGVEPELEHVRAVQ